MNVISVLRGIYMNCWLSLFLLLPVLGQSRNDYQATAELNIRSGPSSSNESIGVIKSGDSLTVLDSSNSYWFKITYKGDTGYVAKRYLIHLAEVEPDVPSHPPKSNVKSGTAITEKMKIGILISCGVAMLILLWAFVRNRKSKNISGANKAKLQAPNVVTQQIPGEQTTGNPEPPQSTVPPQNNLAKPRTVHLQTDHGTVEVPLPKFKVSVTVNNKPLPIKDSFIIDVTGKSSSIPAHAIPGMKKYEPGVPFWSHQYIYSVFELKGASKEQRTFYQEFRSAFLGGTYYDVEGNSNYPFTLMFDLDQECQHSNDVELLRTRYDLLKRYYPKTGNYSLDILIKNYQRIQATEKAAELQAQKPRYTNSSYDFHADYWGLGTRFKSKLNLTDDQVKRLNKLIDTSNNFNSIEYIAQNLIKSFFVSIEKLENHFISCGTTLEAEVNELAILEISKHYKFRKGSMNYKEMMARFHSTIDQVIYKTGENIFREHLFIGRKTEMTWYIKSSEALEMFHVKFGDTISRNHSEYLKTAEAPDDKTEIEFNQYSKARWKNKLEGIKLGNAEHQKFYEAVRMLGIQNEKNPAVENIFFESSKHIAKTDKVTALKLYVHYVDHDLRSVTFDNKQLTKTIQKSLFQTGEQSADFERILAELIKDKNIDKALTAVETIYQPKRKKISLDRNKIKEVQEQHSETVELLNEYLQDSDDVIPETPAQEPISKTEVTKTQSIFNSDLLLNELQVSALVMLYKNGFSISLTDLDQFAKANGAFRSSLIEGINDKCYETLDDVLIEEEEDTYTINESYYNKLLTK